MRLLFTFYSIPITHQTLVHEFERIYSRHQYELLTVFAAVFPSTSYVWDTENFCSRCWQIYPKFDKNSSGDEIANVNFYAVRPEATRIR